MRGLGVEIVSNRAYLAIGTDWPWLAKDLIDLHKHQVRGMLV